MHYLRLEVVFQIHPRKVRHCFTKETSSIFLKGEELLPLDKDTCCTAWDWEQWEHWRVNRGSYKDFDLMMVLHGFSRENWLNYFIAYYPCLPFTWEKTEVAVVTPTPRLPELTFPTGVFVPGLENPTMPLH